MGIHGRGGGIDPGDSPHDAAARAAEQFEAQQAKYSTASRKITEIEYKLMDFSGRKTKNIFTRCILFFRKKHQENLLKTRVKQLDTAARKARETFIDLGVDSTNLEIVRNYHQDPRTRTNKQVQAYYGVPEEQRNYLDAYLDMDTTSQLVHEFQAGYFQRD